MRDLQEYQMRRAADVVMAANYGRLLVVCYGSLPARPETGMTGVGRVVIPGFEKDMCVRVARCRGTSAFPGLVAGIFPKPDAQAMGWLSDVSVSNTAAVLSRLVERELNGLAYDGRPVHVKRPNGETSLALAFAAALWHTGFVQPSTHEAARIIAQSSGDCGTNRDYLAAVLRFEREKFGHVSPRLQAIDRRLRMLTGWSVKRGVPRSPSSRILPEFIRPFQSHSQSPLVQ